MARPGQNRTPKPAGAAFGSHRWSISAIALWEMAKLAQLGRIEVDLDDPSLIRARCHRDPVDRFLVATAQVFELTLVTADATPLALKDVDLASGSVSGSRRGGCGGARFLRSW